MGQRKEVPGFMRFGLVKLHCMQGELFALITLQNMTGFAFHIVVVF